MNSSLKTPRFALALLASGLVLAGISAGFAEESTVNLDIGVRSSADQGWSIPKAKAAAEKTRSQTYGILFVTVVPGPVDIVKPVDAVAVANELEHQLDLQGFNKVKPGTKPEILISAEYGRGWLPNPYETGSMVAGNQGLGGLTAGMQTYTLTSPTDGLHASNAVWQSKRQKNSLEKLYIRVRAWKYPTSPKERLQPIWTTYMVIDDPEHRDLNDVFKAMLAAGANYFGRPLDDPENPEATVTKPVSLGHVEIGTATVIEKDKP